MIYRKCVVGILAEYSFSFLRDASGDQFDTCIVALQYRFDQQLCSTLDSTVWREVLPGFVLYLTLL